jgi:hypothetical protein
MKAFFIAALMALLSPSVWATSTCGSLGAHGPMPCCAGLVVSPMGRCDRPTCVAKDQTLGAGQACCFGTAPVNGVCRVPTLSLKACSILGTQPTAAAPCCTGLQKGSAGTCVRNTTAQCTATQVASCCHGLNKTVNTCPCYCPSPYYTGT